MNAIKKQEVYRQVSWLNRNMYRFDKLSNFITYNAWLYKKTKIIIKQLNEVERLSILFKDFKDSDILKIVATYNVPENKLYFDAIKEMHNRNISL